MLDGGAGDDTLEGGAGNDRFIFGGGDTITDFGSDDIIDIRHLGDINTDNFEATVAVQQNGDDVEVTIGDAVLTLTGVSAADVTVDDFLLTGSPGDNWLNGGEGNDWLDGGAGSDTLDGGAGDDTLDGGAGSDRFYFGVGGDTIADFGSGDDVIDIRRFDDIDASNFEERVTIRQNGSDVEVVIEDTVLTLTGVSADDVAVDDFLLA